MFSYIKAIPILGAIIGLFSNYISICVSLLRGSKDYEYNDLNNELKIKEKLIRSLKFLEGGIIIYLLSISSFLFFGKTKLDVVSEMMSIAIFSSVLSYYSLSAVSLKILDVRIIFIIFSYAYGILFPIQGLSVAYNLFVTLNIQHYKIMYLSLAFSILFFAIPSMVIAWKFLINWTHKGYGINKFIVFGCISCSGLFSYYFAFGVYKYLTTVSDKVKDLIMLVI